jgi:hypothetical protein
MPVILLELFFLVLHWLRSANIDSSKQLEEELLAKTLLPYKINWKNEKQLLSFDELVCGHIYLTLLENKFSTDSFKLLTETTTIIATKVTQFEAFEPRYVKSTAHFERGLFTTPARNSLIKSKRGFAYQKENYHKFN